MDIQIYDKSSFFMRTEHFRPKPSIMVGDLIRHSPATRITLHEKLNGIECERLFQWLSDTTKQLLQGVLFDISEEELSNEIALYLREEENKIPKFTFPLDTDF